MLLYENNKENSDIHNFLCYHFLSLGYWNNNLNALSYQILRSWKEIISMVKFWYVAQFSVDNLSHLVGLSLESFLC